MQNTLFFFVALFMLLSVFGFCYLMYQRDLSKLQANNNHKQQDKKYSQTSITQSAMQSNSRNSQGSSAPTSSVDSSASKSSSSATSNASPKTSTSTAPHSNSHATASTTSQGTGASNLGSSQPAVDYHSVKTQSPRTSETSSAQNARASGAPQAQNSSSASKQQQQKPRTSSFQAPPPPSPGNPANSATAKTSTSGMQGSYSFFLNPEVEQEVRPRRQTSQVDEVEAQRQERERAERKRREQEQQAAQKAASSSSTQSGTTNSNRTQSTTSNTSSTNNQQRKHSRDSHYDEKLGIMHALTYMSSFLLELGHSSDIDFLCQVLTAHANESVNDFRFEDSTDKDIIVLYAHTIIRGLQVNVVEPHDKQWNLMVEYLQKAQQHVNLAAMLKHLCQMSCILLDQLPEHRRKVSLDNLSHFILGFLLEAGFNPFAVLLGVKLKFAQFGYDVELDLGESREEKIAEACKQLGIARDISKEEFRCVKRNKLAQYHPDKAPAGQEEQYKQKFQEISALLDIVESQWK